MSLENYYERLTVIYNILRKANEDYLINNTGIEGFEKLIDLRSTYFDEINELKDELVKDISLLYLDLDYNKMEFFELLKELPRFYPNLLDLKNELLEALQKLVESENNLSEIMTEVRNDLKKELSQARTGKKTLNAYKPATGYAGSHFIDKKK